MSDKLTDKQLKERLIQQSEAEVVKKNDFPTEIIDLPSKGLLYSKKNPLSQGQVEMKYMTAKEEDILASQSLIQRGIVLDKLFQALIIGNGEGKPINYGDLLTGDKDAIMVAARVLGYGKDYEVEITDPFSDGDAVQKVNIDLTKLENKWIDESKIDTPHENRFSFTLPTANKEIIFRLPIHSTEKAIEKELKSKKKVATDKSIDRTLSTRIKHMILSVDGEEDRGKISNFISNHMLAMDSRAFRLYIELVPS